jgi:hypothetical protein
MFSTLLSHHPVTHLTISAPTPGKVLSGLSELAFRYLSRDWGVLGSSDNNGYIRYCRVVVRNNYIVRGSVEER